MHTDSHAHTTKRACAHDTRTHARTQARTQARTCTDKRTLFGRWETWRSTLRIMCCSPQPTLWSCLSLGIRTRTHAITRARTVHKSTVSLPPAFPLSREHSPLLTLVCLSCSLLSVGETHRRLAYGCVRAFESVFPPAWAVAEYHGPVCGCRRAGRGADSRTFYYRMPYVILMYI